MPSLSLVDAGGQHMARLFERFIYSDDQQKSPGEAARRSNINRGDLFITCHLRVACCPVLAALQQVLYLVK